MKKTLKIRAVAVTFCLLSCIICVAAQEALPFYETFDTADGFARFKVDDANNDGTTWEYNSAEQLAQYLYNEQNSADDFLFTPGFTFRASAQYVLTYKCHTRSAGSLERLSVTIGTSQSPSEHNVITPDFVDYVTNTVPMEKSVEFTVPADGIYYIGFRCLSPKDKYYVKLDDVRITEVVNISVPEAVTDFNVMAADAGALSAHISFSVPENDINGEPVQGTLSAEVFRSGTISPVKIFESLQPGEALQFDDTVDRSGKYTYSVVVRNEGGESEPATCTAYIGLDVPLPVRSLSVRETETGIVSISWEAPEGDTGVNGGYAPAADLRYRVIDSTGREIADDINSLNITDTGIDFNEYQPQQVLVYSVYAINGTEVSQCVLSAPVVAGEPYQAPAEESFMYGTTTYYPWYSDYVFSGREAHWTAVTYGASPRVEAYDNDAGLITFRSLAATAGETEGFNSPKFDVSSMKHPELSFAMYHTSSAYDTDKISVAYSVDGGEYVIVGEDLVLGRPDKEAGWEIHSCPLDQAIGAHNVRIALRGTGANGHNIHIDVISLYDNCTDFAVGDIEHDARMLPGDEFFITGKLINAGKKISGNETLLILSRNGEELARQTVQSPAPDEYTEFEFNITEPVFSAGQEMTYDITLVNNDDEIENNNTAELTITCTMPPYPAPENLTATTDGTAVTLSWSPAGSYRNYPITVDGFESYDAFVIDGAGPWKFVDIDGSPTGENEDATEAYDHAMEPMAYQVYNPALAGVDLESWWGQDWKSYEGEQYLAAMYNSDYNPNDDWLISPEISSDKPVSFMARSLTSGYKPESYEIYYSETDDEIESFILLASGTCPARWEEYTFWLPAEAKYFAIRHTTEAAYCFMLDNLSCAMISSTPDEVPVKYYQIYRDEEPLAQVENIETYTDVVPEADRTYTYSVSAVFANGESVAVSLPVEVKEESGVGADALSVVSVCVESRQIIIDAPGTVGCVISDVSGRIIFRDNALSGRVSIPVAPGIYIVRAGNETFKLSAI